MSKLSIKIVIAGRNYPLTINEGEEDVVRKAVDSINSSVKRLQESYAVKDMQDLLAMTALQLATRPQQEREPESSDNTENIKVLSALKVLSERMDIE